METTTTATPTIAKRSDIKSYLIAVLALVVLAAGGASYYFYNQIQTLKKNPSKVSEQEVATIVAQVGKIMILPQGEQPTLATVADPALLKNQAFFAQAKVGYKVLIYTNARKAILYDPTENKIVEVAPINIGNPAPAPTPAPARTIPTQPSTGVIPGR